MTVFAAFPAHDTSVVVGNPGGSGNLKSLTGTEYLTNKRADPSPSRSEDKTAIGSPRSGETIGWIVKRGEARGRLARSLHIFVP